MKNRESPDFKSLEVGISVYSKENIHTFSLHYPVLLLCPFALYCVQNKDDHAYTEINIVW